VTLGADLAAALPELRAEAESLMLDTCTVSPVTGVDESTGAPTPGTAVYAGRCRFQTTEVQVSEPEAGGATYTVLSGRLHVPVAAFANPAPGVDLVASCVTSANNPNLPGRMFRVTGPSPAKSLPTADRLPIEEVR